MSLLFSSRVNKVSHNEALQRVKIAWLQVCWRNHFKSPSGYRALSLEDLALLKRPVWSWYLHLECIGLLTYCKRIPKILGDCDLPALESLSWLNDSLQAKCGLSAPPTLIWSWWIYQTRCKMPCINPHRMKWTVTHWQALWNCVYYLADQHNFHFI